MQKHTLQYFLKTYLNHLVKFESIEVNVPNDYDAFLKSIYGDYMKLPPIEERSNHAHNFIDFGDY